MQNSKVLAPSKVNIEQTNSKYSIGWEFPSYDIDIKFNQNKTISSGPIFISTEKKKLRKMEEKKKLYMQEEKVRNLLDHINNHIYAAIGNNLTIADVTGKYKPISYEFKKLPILHFNVGSNNMNNYHPNPFSPLNSYCSATSSKYSTNDQPKTSESNLNLLSTNDDLIHSNFCGHCKKHFVNGAAHRLTEYHQSKISSTKHWEKIEELFQKFHHV